MSIHYVKQFVLSQFTRVVQLFRSDHEAGVLDHQARPADQQTLDRAIIMIGICLPSAIEIALQSLQTQPQPQDLPPMFQLLSLTIMLSFTFLFVSRFINSRCPMIAQVLEHVGVLFAVTAIFVAITIPLSLFLKCVAWSLYAISITAIIISIIFNISEKLRDSHVQGNGSSEPT